ncbi:MAG: isoaspartyl peptidase/L-asparaginase [Sandaracinaceae bacterium]|nr:isoaspartyl peptidase/L-asparaginase [Sandaracinaceae bacterium]
MSAIVPVVVVHGGAGDVALENRARHQDGCMRAAAAGRDVFAQGGSSLDAVQAAVEVLENDPLFNAGTGACLTEAGTLELDASIMRGSDLSCGAVTGLSPYRNPIRIARAVLEDGKHVLYSGDGAIAFATRAGFLPSTLEEMRTDEARQRLELVLQGRASKTWAGGTVGAVACDAQGRVAAATSTGGTVGKALGRVGDSPLVGAGTYADDELGAGSATGNGEAIIRATLTRTACEYLRDGASPEEAAQRVIALLGKRVQGLGGIILVDTRGRSAAAFNTATMTHAIARLGEDVFSAC